MTLLAGVRRLVVLLAVVVLLTVLRLLVVRFAVVLLAVRLLVVLRVVVVLLAVRLLVVLRTVVVLLAVLRLLVVRVAVRGLPGPLRVLVVFVPVRRLRRLGVVAPSAALLAAFRLRLRAAFLAIADRSALLSTMPHLKNRCVLYGIG
ncbi:MAG: hypothetical protein MPJ02_06970 [Nitrosopumilus sp.]|nr:hypothetical protein [Nitrosopumilus sp.]MDA7999356.1 hypothetical protein [Nitrosopumilus sp.]